MSGKFEIKLKPVLAKARLAEGSARVEVGGVEIDVYPEPEAGGPDKGLTPLGLLASSLAACEALMASLVARMLGVGGVGVEVDVKADIQLGTGLRSLELKFKFSGVSEDLARDIVKMVKSQCPVYNSLARDGVKVKEEILVV
ncbi:MAG: OsmC family protein [Aeropyrum sp.]|nr:OsmC family protein [Aeropyrum sp.]MCE4616308.1 OsmC family protein [Aeropyrum sp.]